LHALYVDCQNLPLKRDGKLPMRAQIANAIQLEFN
jgi:hypothetical protein